MELESDRIGNDANCTSGLPCGNSCQPVSNSCTTSLLPEVEAIADYITNPDNFKDYEQSAIAPRITLETIINPVFTDNGKRSDRATKLQDYTITEGSITGQFVGTHNSNDVLFDFKLVKGGDRWNLTYKYADGQLEPIDSALVATPDELALIQEFADPEIKYGVLRDVLLANNLFDSKDLNRKSASDLSALFDEAIAKTVTLQSEDGHTIQGTIFDVSYMQTGIPTDNVARSKNNDFIIGKEGYVSVRAAIACNLADLQDVDYRVIEIG